MKNLARFYIIYDKDGSIREMGDAGYGLLFNLEEIRFNHPDQGVMKIDEDIYKRLDGQLEYYKVVKGKIIKRNTTEIKKIDKIKESWRENNTVWGLKKKIAELEDEIKKIKLKTNNYGSK